MCRLPDCIMAPQSPFAKSQISYQQSETSSMKNKHSKKYICGCWHCAELFCISLLNLLCLVFKALLIRYIPIRKLLGPLVVKETLNYDFSNFFGKWYRDGWPLYDSWISGRFLWFMLEDLKTSKLFFFVISVLCITSGIGYAAVKISLANTELLSTAQLLSCWLLTIF